MNSVMQSLGANAVGGAGILTENLKDMTLFGIAEAERHVSRFEFRRALEETDYLIVPGIGRHTIPDPGFELWCTGSDERVKPPGHGPIRFRHFGNCSEHCGLVIGFLCWFFCCGIVGHGGSSWVERILNHIKVGQLRGWGRYGNGTGDNERTSSCWCDYSLTKIL
jgi:hypothetical protein